MTTRPSPKTNGQPVSRGAVAGSLALATMIACAAAGFGLGALVGAAVPLGLAGVFIGFVAGFAVVRARFRDL